MQLLSQVLYDAMSSGDDEREGASELRGETRGEAGSSAMDDEYELNSR